MLLGLLLMSFPLMAGAESAAPKGFSVKWKGKAPALTAVASWTYEGDRYEMVVNGLKNKLSNGKLLTLVKAFCANENARLTDSALTDAEKFTHFVPHRAGDAETWVVMDEVRSQEAWGDSLQCWAASAANMLTATGWTALAKDPQTGATFGDEDAVFSYLTVCFFNEGDFQENGVHWFFAGMADDETSLREEAVRKKMLKEDPNRYTTATFTEDCAAPASETLANMALTLARGASMGIAVTIRSTAYPLLADPDIEVNETDGRYQELCFDFLTKDEYYDLPEYDWTFAADGTVIVLEKTGGTYRDADGEEYPAMSVKHDHLYPDAATGEFLLPELMDKSGTYSVSRYIDHAVEEVDLAHPIVRRGLGNGEHALTVGGYIRNASHPDDGMRGIRAFLIADSDNDANIWQIDADTTKKEDRPNTYKLCYTQMADVDDVMTIDLANYLDDGTACIAYACLLYPREEPSPVPVTGDNSPAGLYALLLVCAGAGLLLTRNELARLFGRSR